MDSQIDSSDQDDVAARIKKVDPKFRLPERNLNDNRSLAEKIAEIDERYKKQK
jgi:hypothetical protein